MPGRRRAAEGRMRGTEFIVHVRFELSHNGTHRRFYAAPPRLIARLSPCLALPAQHAGTAGLRRGADPLRHGRVLLPGALPAEPALPQGVHLVRQLHQFLLRQRVLEYGLDLVALYCAHRRVPAAAGARDGHAAEAAEQGQQLHLGHAAAAADDGSRHRGPDVEADDQPQFRGLVLSRRLHRAQRLSLGVEPLLGLVHGGARRHLGLHALHHDPAARRVALPAPTALRGRGARRRAFELRLLPHHLADADPLHHHGGAVPAARLHPAVRHHLCDDPGRPRQQAHGVSGRGLSAVLSSTPMSASRPHC